LEQYLAGYFVAAAIFSGLIIISIKEGFFEMNAFFKVLSNSFGFVILYPSPPAVFAYSAKLGFGKLTPNSW